MGAWRKATWTRPSTSSTRSRWRRSSPSGRGSRSSCARGGDRPAAAELAKLPKPSAAAWALNHVAREDPDAVGDWLATAEELREASTHAADVGGDAIRRAMAEHRTATTRLTGVVRDRAQPSGRPLSEAMLDRVRALLQAATADARVAERLRAGPITEDAAAEAEDAPDEVEVVAKPKPKPKPKPKAKKAARAETPSETPEPAEPAPARPKRDRAAEIRAKRRAELERRVSETSDEHERLVGKAAERVEAAEVRGGARRGGAPRAEPLRVRGRRRAGRRRRRGGGGRCSGAGPAAAARRLRRAGD